METSNRAEYHDRRVQLQTRLTARGLDAYLVTTPTDLRYLTGYDGIADLGPSPFTGGASAGLVVTTDGGIFCLPQQDTGHLPEGDPLDVAAYQTFLELSPLYPRRLFVNALVDTFKGVGLRSGRLGFQPESCPAAVRTALAEHSPNVELEECGEIVGVLRMRKSASELEAVRRSIGVCDAAQAKVRDIAAVGVSEEAILQAIRETVDLLAGGDVGVPLIHEVTSGPRSGRIGFSASERVLQQGDLLLTDIAPQIDGYWGDSCATRSVGEPPADRARMLRVVKEALVRGTEMVRPGVRTSDVDQAMREHVGRTFPAYHNSGGHGIGLDYHEPPRLVPTEELVLDENMVLAMEPGIYLPEVAGVRLEHVVVVTSDGCEVLSRHLLADT